MERKIRQRGRNRETRRSSIEEKEKGGYKKEEKYEKGWEKKIRKE
jgi:hypothetical protein